MKPFLLLIAFFTAGILSLYFTPIMRRGAIQFGIVDNPDGKLKNHREPVPYMGGIAIYLAFLLALAFTFHFNKEALGLLLAGTIVLLLGLIDDLGVLKPWVKLAGQLVAVLVLVKSGIMIKLTFVPTYISIPLTFLWLVGMTNAFNIIDIMDGLSAGVAFIACLAFFGVALVNGRVTIAIMAIALAGSVLGFLRYNYSPARIYMGDAGSMFLGLIIGALAMIGSYTQHNVLGFLAPVMILGIPIFDTAFVMLVRWKKGLPVFRGSPDHFAIRLGRCGLGTKSVVRITYGAAMCLAALGILLMHQSSISHALVLALLVFAASVVVTVLLYRVKVT